MNGRQNRRSAPQSIDDMLGTPSRLSLRDFDEPEAESVTGRTEYKLETDIGIGSFLANTPQQIDQRPSAVFRWSHDDYLMRELPVSDCCDSQQKQKPNQVVVAEVITSGITDNELIQRLQPRLNVGAGSDCHIQLSQPAEFVSVSKRFVFLPQAALSNPNFATQQVFHGDRGGGTAVVSPVRLSPVMTQRGNMNEFTMVFRGCGNCSAQAILGRVDRIKSTGVVNYSSSFRHGFHLSRSFKSGIQLMNRQFGPFLCRYLNELPEGFEAMQREVDAACHMIAATSTGAAERSWTDWTSIAANMQTQRRKLRHVLDLPMTGICAMQVDMLCELAERVAALSSRAQSDTARVIRETICRRHLEDTLRAVSDVHFNAFATLRLQLLGNSVQVGDLVVQQRGVIPSLDGFTTRGDHHYALGEHLQYVDREEASHLALHRVESEIDAARFSLEDVVLPTFGRVRTDSEQQQYPKNRCGKLLFDELAVNLRIAHLSEMKLASLAYYRPLVVKPRNVQVFLADDVRNVFFGDETLKNDTFLDSEGLRRLVSPLKVATGRQGLARSGIHGTARERFLDLARRPGFTAFLKCEIPIGSSPMSVVRELVKARTVNPSAIISSVLKKR